MKTRLAAYSDASGDSAFISAVHNLFDEGLFDDQYGNISCMALELKESFIYKAFSHIGSSMKQKTIGNALQRCWYDKDMSYHGLAFVPDSDKVIIMTKCHASMARDEKTRNHTGAGEAPKKKEYLLFMELQYQTKT